MAYLAWLFICNDGMSPFFYSSDRRSTQRQGIQIVRWDDWMSYLMAYQAKIIEESSWLIFAEPFHCFHIHIKMWSSINSYDEMTEWVYLMVYQAKLIEEGLWCIFAETFHCFYINIKVWRPNEDQRGLHEEG